jgi:hypothetical protein
MYHHPSSPSLTTSHQYFAMWIEAGVVLMLMVAENAQKITTNIKKIRKILACKILLWWS